MADLPEEAIWEDGVYQIEQEDPVLGGAPNIATMGGLSNIPNWQNARRTRWLKEQVDGLLDVNLVVAGLLQGGGPLDGDLQINVPEASQTQAEAGTASNVAMTPRRTRQLIDAAFTGSLASPGWMRFSNGLIMQWGRTSINTAAQSGTQTLTMPLAFTTVALAALACDVSNDQNKSAVSASMPNLTQLSITWYRVGGTNYQGSHWIALGV